MYNRKPKAGPNLDGVSEQTKVAEMDARCAGYVAAMQRADREAVADKECIAALRAAVARLHAQVRLPVLACHALRSALITNKNGSHLASTAHAVWISAQHL